jgi:carbon starvation protein cstA
MSMLGTFGGILAVLGVVVLPITSGDTAFRAARLQIAEFLGDYMDTDQRKIGKRLLITIPLFVVGVILTRVDFTVLWRYFSWANQTTATIMLWTAAAYLYRHQKFHWVCTIPAVFMTQVCASYLFFDQKIGFGWVWAKVGFGEHLWDAAMVSGAVVAAALTALFFIGLKPSGMNAGGIVAVSMDD